MSGKKRVIGRKRWVVMKMIFFLLSITFLFYTQIFLHEFLHKTIYEEYGYEADIKMGLRDQRTISYIDFDSDYYKKVESNITLAHLLVEITDYFLYALVIVGLILYSSYKFIKNLDSLVVSVKRTKRKVKRGV